MTFTEALTILKRSPAGTPFEVWLACGFTPLHLEKLLGAHLQETLPDRRIAVRTGLFENLAGTLEAIPGAGEPHAVAVAIEWADLDPRLGYRQLGGWGPEQEADFAATVTRSCARIQAAIERILGCPVAVSLPTLALPPVFHTAGWQASASQWELEAAVADFARSIASRPNVHIASRQRIAELASGPSENLKTGLQTGLPYRIEHASAVAQTLAWLIHPPAPKKGLITDLDDTLWCGIVGEVGAEAVRWDLASHQQIHGLYQQLLKALAESGVLVGVASKNDPTVVEQALKRPDLVISADRMFPLEVHWHAKSGSVSKILKTWNISADAVVFIDDSPIELEEVAAAHPGITCLEFPRNNPEQTLALFQQLRDLFGKARLAAEDSYRLDSIRRAAPFQEVSLELGSAPEELLAGLSAEITIELDPPLEDARVLELVNKTNQFNLNGARYTDADWLQNLRRSGAFAAAISYRDKFGPLGKIAVMQGHTEGRELHIAAWVMSCRAFARRVEHQCLSALFGQTGAHAVVLNYKPTAKNGPLREFLEQILEETPAEGQVRLGREAFEARRPRLYHNLQIKRAAEHSFYG